MSPICNLSGAFFGVFLVPSIVSSLSVSLSALRRFARSFSISFVMPEPFIHLLYLRMDSSAVSFAFWIISWASSFARRKILSLAASIRSFFAFILSRKCSASSRIFFAFSRSFSAAVLASSSPVTTSSKLRLSESTSLPASSIISFGSPNFPDIANALLFPGTPTNSR